MDSLSIVWPFPCPVTYQSDVELRDLAQVEKNKNKMCWFPLEKNIEDWVILILHGFFLVFIHKFYKYAVSAY